MNKIILKNLIIFPFLLTCLFSEEPLSIGFWNVENLFDLINDPNKNDDEFALGGRKKNDQKTKDSQQKLCIKLLFLLKSFSKIIEIRIKPIGK